MPRLSLTGLVAATFTPFEMSGEVAHQRIAPMVDELVGHGIAGLYVLGSTGEGLSLTFTERCETAKSFVDAVAGRIPVIVQVGSESLRQSRDLATHAQEIGADAISAVSPVYFKPDSLNVLIDSMAEIAAGAPSLPFYYYHIPGITGVAYSMREFLLKAGDRIPSLAGIKFTSPAVHEYQAAVEVAGDKYEVLWGVDEMFLSGLAAGGKAAVGSTYNFAAPVYKRLLAAFDAGNWDEANRYQSQSQEIVRTFVPYGPRASQKAIMGMVGEDCGPPRLPIPMLSPEKTASLRSELADIGFFDWIARSED